MRDECEHGSLRRSCEICERNEEIRRTKEAFQNHMQCVGELKEYLHNAQQMIDALKQQVEDLKCCGNCKHIAYDEQTGELSCENDHYPFRVTGRCDNWTFDGKTREERR